MADSLVSAVVPVHNGAARIARTRTDLDAMKARGEVFARRFLTTIYGANHWFERVDLLERWVPFPSVHPDLAALPGEVRLYAGNVFSAMRRPSRGTGARRSRPPAQSERA